jgi:transcriptional regulator with XRE-family HTH domain
LTLADVSARIDKISGEQVTRHTLSKIERGTRPASVTELVLIAYVLGVTPTSLLTTRGDDSHKVRLTAKVGPMTMQQWRRWVTGREPLDGQAVIPTWVIDAGAVSVEELRQGGTLPRGGEQLA